MDNINRKLFEWINIGLSNRFLDIFLSYISKLGSVIFAIVFILAILLLLKNYRLSIKITFIIFFNILVVQIIKYIFNTSRPFQLESVNSKLIYSDILVKTLGPGFPSSHTTVVFTLAFIMHKLYSRLSPLYFFIATIVGFSRIYLGVHYPFDVLVGALLGLFSGFLWNKRFKLEEEVVKKIS